MRVALVDIHQERLMERWRNVSGERRKRDGWDLAVRFFLAARLAAGMVWKVAITPLSALEAECRPHVWRGLGCS